MCYWFGWEKEVAMRDLVGFFVITFFAIFVLAMTAPAFAAGTGYGQ
jgi:hypothetical protein